MTFAVIRNGAFQQITFSFLLVFPGADPEAVARGRMQEVTFWLFDSWSCIYFCTYRHVL